MRYAREWTTAGCRAAFRLSAMAALLASATPTALHAQAAPPTREELEIVTPPRQPEVNANRLTVDGGIERGPCPLAAPSLTAMRVRFSRVNFTQVDAIPAGTLDATWRDIAGQDLPIAALCDVRDRAATMLREMGYLAAVQIPPQRIETNGEVRMDVLVAKLVELQVRGDAGRGEKLIAAHLERFSDDRWFNVNEAERQLLLLSELPGYDVRLTLRSAGRGPGEVIGDLLVQRRPVELVAGVQNLGSKATGREGVFAQLVLNGLTGLGDRTLFSLYNTLDVKEQTVAQVGHEFALGTDGLRLGGHFVYGRGEPSLGSGSFKTQTLIGRAELTYPLVLRRATSIRGAAGIEAVDQEVRFAGTPITRDKLRILYGRLDVASVDEASLIGRGGYTPAEPRWRVAASLQARHGLAELGASDDCTPIANCAPPNTPISNIGADPSAFVARLEGSVEYRPVPTLTLALAPRFQYSSQPLLSFEQYSLGNYTIGRGFDPGTVLGDKGAGAAFEVRMGKLQPQGPDAVALQPFLFFDAAWAWTNDDGATPDPRRLLSAGAGVRARWGDEFDANLMLAAPLERAGFQADRGDIRALFTITARVLPWNF